MPGGTIRLFRVGATAKWRRLSGCIAAFPGDFDGDGEGDDGNNSPPLGATNSRRNVRNDCVLGAIDGMNDSLGLELS